MPDRRIKILLIGTWHFHINSTNNRNTSNLTIYGEEWTVQYGPFEKVASKKK